MDPNQEKIQGNTLTTPTGVQVDLTTGQPITGQALTPATSSNYQQPNPTPYTPAIGGPDLSQPLQPTEQETKISNIDQQLADLNDQLLGQTDYAKQQREAQGISGLTKTQDDLNSKLQLLQANEVNIPLQLQNESIGRGITVGGAAPIENARLRENAISANIIKAQLAGIQGKIATANSLVDQAVQDKFGPLEEKQRILKANLDLLINDPKTSLQDKNRALAQKAIQDAKDAKLAQQKADYEATQKKILEYSGVANSAQLSEMAKAKTQLEVTQIAAKYGLRTLDEKYRAAQAQSLIASANAKTPVVNSDGTQNYSTIDISRYSRAANAIVKNFIGLPQYNLTANGLPYLQRIQAADSIPGSVSDAELLDSIVKLNTGGNQVTEAQVRLITSGKSFADALNVWENKLQNGGVLSDSQRQQLTQLATKVFERYQKDYQPIYEQATKQLKAAGIPEAFWTIPDLTTLSGQESGKIGSSSGIPELDDYLNGL